MKILLSPSESPAVLGRKSLIGDVSGSAFVCAHAPSGHAGKEALSDRPDRFDRMKKDD
jgi:hypothetical protein